MAGGVTHKLTLMDVLVAVLTSRELDLKDGRRSGWNMALHAGHTRVPPFQGISCQRMGLHSKRGWLKTIDCVTDRAISAVFARQKLATVWIWFVAVSALAVSHRPVQITPGMARVAAYRCVFTGEWELGLGVIKSSVHVGE